jgi:hypothetical protein
MTISSFTPVPQSAPLAQRFANGPGEPAFVTGPPPNPLPQQTQPPVKFLSSVAGGIGNTINTVA